MPKTNSQRQATYRNRRLESNDERLNMFIDPHSKCCLERLAFYYGLTQRAIVEKLLVKANWDAMDNLPPGVDYNLYQDKLIKAAAGSVTQLERGPGPNAAVCLELLEDDETEA